MTPIKINKVEFENACKEICKEDWYKRENYLSIKKDKIKTHFLRPGLRDIAFKYFPNTVIGGSRFGFPVEIVVAIAKKMNVYVTDIIRF